ncbi:MAG: F0F1 ATP synthase subunit gamma [Anaerolineae bacterium]|nr:F0F1 ATP synthase subunit gamma [Anaerolineae bacterium]
MATTEAIRRRIESTEDLQSVVKTMKALAAAHIWQYQQAVAALDDYNHTLELGLQIVLNNRAAAIDIVQPKPEPRLGAIVLGSDQGMVGRFNEQITTFALDKMNERQVLQQDRHVLAVGMRITTGLEAAGQSVEDSFPVPGSIAGITPLVQDLLLQVDHWRSELELEQIVIFYNKPRSGAAYEPEISHLLPVDLDWLQQLQRKPWPTRMLPTFSMDWAELFAALLRQYFFVGLYRALAGSLASENASRLASMQAAEKNVEKKMDELNAEFHRERQRAITEELLDIVAGAEALN